VRGGTVAHLARLLIRVVVLALVALAISASGAHAVGAWREQLPSLGRPLRGIDFVDLDHGWAVGDGGTVLATSDGGAHWTSQVSGTTGSLQSVDFADVDNGWAVGDQGEIIATSDGGAHWATQRASDDPTVVFFSVSFSDALHGLAVGNHSVFATNDGGLHWVAQTPASGQLLFAVAAIDASRACVVGNQGTTMWTSDAGSHWFVGAGPDLYSVLRAVTFADPTHGWAVGSYSQVYATADGGSHWIAQSGPTGSLTAVAFSDADHGWVVGDAGTIFHTSDGGAHWTYVPSGTEQLLGVTSVDATHAWAVTYSGAILAYDPLPDTCAPVTTLSSDPTSALSGWSNRDASVSLEATDGPDGTGVVGTYYALDDGIAGPYAGTFAVSAEGAHTIRYWSVDASGNVEAGNEAAIHIDKTPPVATVDAQHTYVGSASVGAIGTDGLSGLGYVEMRLDGGPWTRTTRLSTASVGSHVVYARAWDRAGNSCDASGTFTVTKPPADVRNPIAPARMSHSRYYNVYGYLKPRHTARTSPVRIYKYRLVSGHWRSCGYDLAKASNYSSYSKYSHAIRLPTRGTWRMRAYAPADAAHAAAWSSGYDYIRVY
jgi:photosystem II stability/assembly factor-like uncharacterized protein